MCYAMITEVNYDKEIVLEIVYDSGYNSYKVRKGTGLHGHSNNLDIGGTSTPDQRGGNKRFIKLSIKSKQIEETHSESEISFDNPFPGNPGKKKTFENTLGFIPCVEIFNNPKGFSSEGSGEFEDKIVSEVPDIQVFNKISAISKST